MAIREVREMGDDVLEKQCKPVTKMTLRTKILIEDMLDTMYDANGVGLAAPQVTYLMHDLAEKGIPVDLSATTVAEARDSILYAFILLTNADILIQIMRKEYKNDS